MTLHDLLSPMSPIQRKGIASIIGCCPEQLDAAIADRPGYHDHSIALHQVYAVLRGDPMPGDPWPDGADPTFVVEQATAIGDALRACFALMPAKSADDGVPVRRVVVVPSDNATEVLRDLRALDAAGVAEAIMALDMDDAEIKRERFGVEHVVQIGYAPGSVRVGGEIKGTHEWLREIGWSEVTK